MKLVAEILTGSLFYVQVDEDANVGDLKNEIANQQNLPRDRLALMLDADDQRSMMVKDDVPLKEYGVQDGSHVYVFFEPLVDGATSSPSTPQASASNQHSNAPSPSPSADQSNEQDKTNVLG